jgi:hypothetical protein
MGEVQQDAKDNGDEEMESSSKSADAFASTLGKDEKEQEDLNRPLTQREILNLTFALFAWACTICNVTLSTYRTVMT